MNVRTNLMPDDSDGPKWWTDENHQHHIHHEKKHEKKEANETLHFSSRDHTDTIHPEAADQPVGQLPSCCFTTDYSTRRLWLSGPRTYGLKQINLSLVVTWQTPSLLKLHLERAGVSSFFFKYLLTGGRFVGGMPQHLLIQFMFIVVH